ncbi:hypothetical protein [Clostridium kluyveri]|uniref:hypothetical protein n=1 Tax=Clostridium kluyveri TaxID=1534 RepID=UPI0003263292|nr:hypothetical protein [Clostridium kluyveri]
MKDLLIIPMEQVPHGVGTQRRSSIKTPVKNLYIGSCWAMQIGGVPGALVAAYQCAKKIK